MITPYLSRSISGLCLSFLVWLISGGFGHFAYAAPPAQNPYPECPPNSPSIWVQADTNDFGTDEIVQIPFETGEVTYKGNTYVNYLLGVLLAEIGPAPDFNPVDENTMKSMAILARTVAYRNCGCEITVDNINCSRSIFESQGSFHRGLDDNIKQQYDPTERINFTQAEREQYQQAIDETADTYLIYNQRVFDAQYGPISDYRTGDLGGSPHLGIYDPAGIYHEGAARQPGFPQINANHYALGDNHGDHLPPQDYRRLLEHYLDRFRFVGLSPAIPEAHYQYLFNVLHFGRRYGGFSGGFDDQFDDPLILRQNHTFTFDSIIQNTSDRAWPLSCDGGVALSDHLSTFPDNRYLPGVYFEGARNHLCPSAADGAVLAPSQEFPSQRNGPRFLRTEIWIDPAIAPGDYWLRLDVEFPFESWGSGLHPQTNSNQSIWPPQDIHIYVEKQRPDPPNPGVTSGHRYGQSNRTWSNNPTVAMTWPPVNDRFLNHYQVCWDKRDDGQGARCHNNGTDTTFSRTFADGIYDFELRAMAGDGPQSDTAAIDNIRIDATPPAAQLFSLPERVQALTYRLTWLSVDSGGSGLVETRLEYRIRRDDQVIADWRRVTAVTNPATEQLLFDFPGGRQGDRYEFCLQVRDGAGSWSDADCDSTTFKPEPELHVSPLHILRFRVYTDTVPSVETLRIENDGGGGALDWTATTPFTLASLSPTRGQTPAAVTVTLTHPVGVTATYTGVITVSAETPGVHNSPQRVRVTIWVVERIFTAYFPLIFKQ